MACCRPFRNFAPRFVVRIMGKRTSHMMIPITTDIAIDESEIKLDFIRAPGPGGQKVNKVATAVQLRFDVAHSPNLSDHVRARLMHLAGRRITEHGVLVIHAKRFRTQDRNRQDAIDRLIRLIRGASEKPKRRFKTKPSKASREQRLVAKRHRSRIKRLRRTIGSSDS
jgi:ribosome-associated protein